MLDNGLDEFWRTARPWREVKLYLRSRGLGAPIDPGYRALPISDEDRLNLWGGCYNPDILPQVTERFENQWQLTEDREGDRQIYRLLLVHALDQSDALVAASGVPIEHLGPAAEPPLARPDIDALLDPSLPLLPVISAAA